MGIEFSTQLAVSALGFSVQSFVKADAADPRELTLRPAFQRNLVWNDVQRSYLVDSILRGFPVPEVYIQRKTDAEGIEEIIVVDGQQRIETCLRFIRGDLTLVDDAGISLLDDRWKGKQFSDLDSDLKARFRSFEFIARQLPQTLDESVLREIFRRMNQTVESLEPQELRHAAYTGEFIMLVESISSSLGLTELGVFSAKDIQRRRSDAFVSEVLFAFLIGELPNKKEGLDAQYMIYERGGMPSEHKEALIWRWGRVDAFLQLEGQALKRTRFRNKSDAYSLLFLLLNEADRFPLSANVQSDFVSALKDFSDSVNEIRRQENVGDVASAPPNDDHLRNAAVSYLRGVELAASDRANRVRRDRALHLVLDPILNNESAKPPSDIDSLWVRDAEPVSSSTEPDGEKDGELAEVQRILLEEA